MASKKKEMRNPLQEAFNTLKESTAEEYVDILKDEWNEMLERGREPIIEFDNGDYYYIEPDWENKKFYAGHAFNAGIMREVEIPMDPDMNLDEHIAELFDTAIDMDPSLLGDEDLDFDLDADYEDVIQDLMSRFGIDRETAEKWYEEWHEDDDWNDPDTEAEFINIGEDLSTGGDKESESRKLTEGVHRASPAKDMIQEFFGTDLESTLRNYFGDISRYDFNGKELKMSFDGEKDIHIPKALQQMADEGLAEIDTASRIFGSHLDVTFPHLSSALSLEYDCREEKCTPDDVANTYNLFGKFIDEISGGNTNESLKSGKGRGLKEDRKTVDVNAAREALDTIEFYLFGDIGYFSYEEREELDSDAKSAYRKLKKFIDGVEKHYIKGE